MTLRTLLLALLVAGAIAPARSDVVLDNGTKVPTDSMLVFVFVGHSNMSGRADQYGTTNVDSLAQIRSIYFDKDAFLWSYHIEDAANTLSRPTGTWLPAVGRIREDSDKKPGEYGWVGPGMPVLKKLRSYYPKHHIGIVQVASGWAQLKSQYLDDNTSASSSNMWSEIRSALTNLKGKVRFAGVVTMLGIIEVNANSSELADRFGSDLDTFITRIREVAGDPAIPLLASDLEQGDRKTICSFCSWYIDNPIGDTITRRIVSATQAVPHARMIDTKWSVQPMVGTLLPYFRDDHHYNRVGMMHFADETIRSFLEVTSFPPYCNPSDTSCRLKPDTTGDTTIKPPPPTDTANGFAITSPLPGSQFATGNTLDLRWTTNLKLVSDAYPEVSLDSGRTWLGIGLTSSVLPDDPEWEHVTWTIPETMIDRAQKTVALAGRDLRLRLTSYTGTSKAETHILVQSPAGIRLRNRLAQLGIVLRRDALGRPVRAERTATGTVRAMSQLPDSRPSR